MKNLIPMNDREICDIPEAQENLKNDSEEEILECNLADRTVYGDFSMNSFLIVDTPEKEEKEEIASVYMGSILDIMQNLNTKIDTLRSEKSEEWHVLERVMSFLKIGDSRSAEETIQSLNVGSPRVTDVYTNLIQKTLPQFFILLKEELLNTKEIAIALKNIYNETDTKLYKKLEENERLKNIINQQSKDHKIQIDELSRENNYLKDELLKITTEFGGTGKIDSFLEEDILLVLRNKIQDKLSEMGKLKELLACKEEALRSYQMRESSFDISHLNIQVDGLKKSQKKLQDENLNLTQIVNKLSEKNTKLKQELIFFNSELKKAMDVVGKKNETIARQKNLIELFQEKLCGSAFPIEELRKKKQEVERKLVNETDYFVKQELKRECEDCEKRLSDFLTLGRKM